MFVPTPVTMQKALAFEIVEEDASLRIRVKVCDYECQCQFDISPVTMKDITTELAAPRRSVEQQSELQEEANAIMRNLVGALNQVAQELAIPEKEAHSSLS